MFFTRQIFATIFWLIFSISTFSQFMMIDENTNYKNSYKISFDQPSNGEYIMQVPGFYLHDSIYQYKISGSNIITIDTILWMFLTDNQTDDNFFRNWEYINHLELPGVYNYGRLYLTGNTYSKPDTIKFKGLVEKYNSIGFDSTFNTIWIFEEGVKLFSTGANWKKIISYETLEGSDLTFLATNPFKQDSSDIIFPYTDSIYNLQFDATINAQKIIDNIGKIDNFVYRGVVTSNDTLIFNNNKINKFKYMGESTSDTINFIFNIDTIIELKTINLYNNNAIGLTFPRKTYIYGDFYVSMTNSSTKENACYVYQDSIILKSDGITTPYYTIYGYNSYNWKEITFPKLIHEWDSLESFTWRTHSPVQTGDTLDLTKLRTNSLSVMAISEPIKLPDTLYFNEGLFNVTSQNPYNYEIDLTNYHGSFGVSGMFDSVTFGENNIIKNISFINGGVNKILDLSPVDSIYGDVILYQVKFRDVILPDTSKRRFDYIYFRNQQHYLPDGYHYDLRWFNSNRTVKGMTMYNVGIYTEIKKTLQIDTNMTYTSNLIWYYCDWDSLNFSSYTIQGTQIILNNMPYLEYLYLPDSVLYLYTLRSNNLDSLKSLDLSMWHDSVLNENATVYIHNNYLMDELKLNNNENANINIADFSANLLMDSLIFDDFFLSTNTLSLFSSDSLSYVSFDKVNTLLNMYYCPSMGVIDLTGKFDGSCTINIHNNSWDAATVNEYLFNFDNDPLIGSGIILDISGDNAAPDGTSGGFDGISALNSLVSKGVTITIN